jgi:hypothetical protein
MSFVMIALRWLIVNISLSQNIVHYLAGGQKRRTWLELKCAGSGLIEENVGNRSRGWR